MNADLNSTYTEKKYLLIAHTFFWIKIHSFSQSIHSVSVHKKRWKISTNEALYTGFLNFPKNTQIFTSVSYRPFLMYR